MSATETPESGTLPGRFEFAREPSYFGIPTDPSWQRYSDVIRSFEAGPGLAYSAQTATGTPDAQDHFRGQEDPTFSIGYDLQQELVDGSGDPVDAAADGILRDDQNQLQNSHLMVHRMEHSGGNDNAGIREYTVIRGGKIESVSADLDPTSELPILMELTYAPRKVRSYLIHQPSASTTLEIVSTESNDTMDVTIENEAAGTTETVSLNGTTAVTTTESFGDIDAVWLDDNPEGDVTITDGSGTTLMEIDGGLSYSDDSRPIDGDRGIPALGSGSHASAIGTSYEHFVGDRLERPANSSIRARVISASWSVENDVDGGAIHTSRLPVVDENGRTVTLDTDVAGKTVSHENFVDSLTKDVDDIEHEMSSTLFTFKNTVPTSVDPRSIEPEQARAEYSVTWEAHGEPAITVSQP